MEVVKLNDSSATQGTISLEEVSVSKNKTDIENLKKDIKHKIKGVEEKIQSFISSYESNIYHRINQIFLCNTYKELISKRYIFYSYCYVMSTCWYKGIKFKGLYYKTVKEEWKKC